MKTIEEIIEKLPEDIRLPIYEAFQVFQKDIIHKDLQEIRNEIKEVWKAIKELTESQKRTEQRVTRLEKAVEELAQAQKGTEQRVTRLEKVVEELAQAQKRTEERVEELAQAQKRTDEKVKDLAGQVEKLTIEVRNLTRDLQKLTEEHRKTRKQLGSLSHAFGYVLEDRAIKSLPDILKKNYNIEVIGKLRRDYLIINGEYIEVNIYGKVKKNNIEYTLVGEAKSKVSKRIIDNFVKKCNKIAEESIKIIVSYIFTPEIKKYAENKGVILIPSYELEF